jgi:hypothetical protein
MKKSILYSLMLAASSMLMFSCENDFDNAIANPDASEFADLAAMVRFEEPVVGGITLTSQISFSGMLVDPGDNVASYDLRISLDGTNFTPFLTVTTFPSELTVTLAETESAIGQSLAPGTSIVFDAIITRDDGQQFTSNNLTGDTFNQGQRQAMLFNAFVSCPFDANEAAGTYEVVNGNGAGLFGDGTTFEVVAGPGPAQISIVGFGDGSGNTTDLVLDVDPDIGTASPAPGQVTHNFGFDLDPLAQPSGFAFSCVGSIVLTGLEYGCCGGFPFELSKI